MESEILKTFNKKIIIFIIILILVAGCASQSDRRKELLRGNIHNLLGTPYQWGTISKKGIDCSGFTQEVYRRAGVAIPRTVQEQFEKGREVEEDELEYGDLVFFHAKPGDSLDCCLSLCILPNLKVHRSKTATHVGIYLDGRKFVHASASRGVVADDLNSQHWKERFAGARRLLD
ncbi:MAG: hypothetical protein A3C43_02595 [Candidatus Schekmanbacteria bacterium RIFCSPHIGHO2_02_FULL_38_11]|uniref:NlpC/P60 domain-containing protein n=1 Tax=Candidatus Schekmanbacteria bacterium RIFCSPLOWO2_12_FULL_38_15 TaxID=1817883 RepID=A0A1F7SI71_9BACT|nr:MAG: hypothetical protein A2043_06450 [Candidatus Schekmanbacteria bacterium GWA2_38_9]OGL50779.1 MAG: hypothetical protein A3H37_02905 [Candidatus Schekmanbacteria bacterium RIFCSPLOWO2_02_FULL_38_14]OGL53461.1 MAG: hypothetical protein A3G31_08160 [Candidatus Schekmanbacteria bacterium RIFCSPLOWO2_12_FULL_38_15]OGL54957.1 MAG: hypothetical protein A3C43_02595 [Candidatus Schekmanbacteria bacterium RIFCSPHIGHO2_02_FULL_38_11]